MPPATDPGLVFAGDGELAGLMRDKDWAATPLGPVEQWPTALRTAVRIVLTSRFAMWMGWGDELVMFYNDAYRRDTLGVKHPWALAQPASAVWSEIWTDVQPRIQSVLAGGGATWDEALFLVLERGGYPEETYHTFSYSPLHDDDGHIRGMLCVVVEETARFISERRVKLLGTVATAIANKPLREDVLAGFARSIEATAHDLPFTLTYLFEPDGGARLVSSTGFPAPHPAALPMLPPGATSPWRLDEILATDAPARIPLAGDVAWPTGPWAVPPTGALLVPIAQQGQTRPAGVVVAGLNPLRALDAPYREFLALLVGQLAAGLASADAYAQERRRAEALAELDRAKTAFFSNVSHEFRTPLTLMLGPLGSLLADPDLAAPLREELTTIHRNGRRLLKLVNTMLDFSRIEAGRATAQFQPVDLALLTCDLASVFRAATDKAGLRFTVTCAPLDVPIAVDVDMWEKIVLNLLSNAFKFTLAGEIAVSLARRGDHVDLVVRDTGSGIPPAELPRIFDRFHRVEGSVGRTYEGTGIGLALVQELVKLHHGAIAVESTLGVGTTFTVTIPIVAELAGALGPPVPRAAESSPFVEEALRWLPDAAGALEATGVGPTAERTRERVLVVDDNADMRGYLRRLVAVRRDVETASNGALALAAMRAQRPNLVITDVMMPELDGFGLVAAMAADPTLREIPVLMLSARAGDEARVEGLQAGASAYLVKPFTSNELLAHVETQLVRAAVREVEERQARQLQSIFEQAPVAIATFRGPDHVFEIANQRYREIVGGRELVGRSLAAAIPETTAGGFVALLDGVYRSGKRYVGTSLPLTFTPTGAATPEEHFFDVMYEPMHDGTGAVSGIAAVVHDVTALAVARRDAENANRAKDEFLAMLGHELRNPLAPITTALQLMRLRPEADATRERAVIERQVQHLIGLVDDLLDVSRIARGKVELRLQTLELADIVTRAIEIVSPLLEEHRHVLAVDVPRGLALRADAGRLTQVVSNLLSNAAKYTPGAGKISVTGTRAGPDLLLRVADNGVGIDPDMLPRVFDAFAQAPQTFDRAQGGLGLGLAIVNNLVKLHGGAVTATSRGRGQGTELVIRLPALDATGSVAVPRVASRDLPRAEARILIVDDNVDAAEMLADLLAAGGYETRARFDGPTALELAEEFHPAIAILDLGLPVMDGFELARHIQANPALARTKLIAVTGYGQAQDRVKTTAAGFAAHLVKPVDVAKLRAVIAQLATADT